MMNKQRRIIATLRQPLSLNIGPDIKQANGNGVKAGSGRHRHNLNGRNRIAGQ